MELSSPNVKKILLFSQKKAFLIFSKKKDFLIFGNGTMHFSAQDRKMKNPSRENFLYFRKRKTLRNPYISGSRTFLYFRKAMFRTLA